MLNRRKLLRLLGLGSVAAPVVSIAAGSTRIQSPLEVLDTYVAGLQHYQSLKIVHSMATGDLLELKREPDNQHDANAIAVYWQTKKIGYVPRVNNLALSRMMDKGQQIAAEINWLDDHPWQPVGLVVRIWV